MLIVSPENGLLSNIGLDHSRCVKFGLQTTTHEPEDQRQMFLHLGPFLKLVKNGAASNGAACQIAFPSCDVSHLPSPNITLRGMARPRLEISHFHRDFHT